MCARCAAARARPNAAAASGAANRAGERARSKGSSQVLWLDALEHKYVEEGGGMNVMFKIAGKVVTPMLTGSILDGITRRSCIAMLRSWGTPVRRAADQRRRAGGSCGERNA